MSTAVAVPPPNSSSLLRHVPRLTARARGLLTAMNLHYAGVAALAVIVVYLLAHLVFTMQALSARNADAVAAQQVQLKAAEIAALPLRGLDSKVVNSTEEADQFYQRRLPYATSQVVAELGALTKRQGVRLSRVQYAYAPVLSGANTLTEVRLDASVSGDYRPIMQFVNATERDRMFFVIYGINLTGQQTGQVNLRIRLLTYLRTPNTEESMRELPPTDTTVEPASGPAAGLATGPGGAQ